VLFDIFFSFIFKIPLDLEDTDLNFYEKHCEKYLERYKRTESFFRADSKRIAALKAFSKLSAYAVYAAYIILSVYLAIKADIRLVRVIVIPAAAFFLVTVIRSALNFKRPYEKYPITPLVSKSTKGKSCPSRHTACAVIIALAYMYISLPLGVVMMIISLLIAASRPVMGVHFPLDIIFGGLLSLVIGIIGFWTI